MAEDLTSARKIGSTLQGAAKKIAAHTCGCTAEVVPDQVRGRSPSAATIPNTHCTAISPANMRSVPPVDALSVRFVKLGGANRGGVGSCWSESHCRHAFCEIMGAFPD